MAIRRDPDRGPDEPVLPSTTDPRMHRALELIQRVTGFESVHLTRVDGDVDEQWVDEALDTGTLRFPRGTRLAWSDSICRWAERSQQWQVQDAAARFGDCPQVADQPIQSHAGVPLRDASGRLVGTVCCVDHRPLALPVEERAVVEGIADLLRGLVEAKQEALEAQNFIRLAVHELRRPLGVASGYASMLAEGAFGDLPPGAERATGQLSHQLATARGLLDTSVEVLRVEDRRLTPRPEALELSEVVQSVVARLETDLPPTHWLEVDAGPHPLPVFADRYQVTTAIANLIDNAVKYSPEGGEVRLDVGPVQPHDARGRSPRGDGELTGVAEVRVSDQGLGIAPHDLPRLFQRFQRLDAARKGRISGTGLGLYLSREIVRSQGGDVLASSPGQGLGSTFTLRLPLVRT
jgi:signal transduction histidine kinase